MIAYEYRSHWPWQSNEAGVGHSPKREALYFQSKVVEGVQQEQEWEATPLASEIRRRVDSAPVTCTASWERAVHKMLHLRVQERVYNINFSITKSLNDHSLNKVTHLVCKWWGWYKLSWFVNSRIPPGRPYTIFWSRTCFPPATQSHEHNWKLKRRKLWSLGKE